MRVEGIEASSMWSQVDAVEVKLLLISSHLSRSAVMYPANERASVGRSRETVSYVVGSCGRDYGCAILQMTRLLIEYGGC